MARLDRPPMVPAPRSTQPEHPPHASPADIGILPAWSSSGLFSSGPPVRLKYTLMFRPQAGGSQSCVGSCLQPSPSPRCSWAWPLTGQAVPGVQKGWRPLFDGKSLDGWEHVGPGRDGGRGRGDPHRGRHGPALVHPGEARRLRRSASSTRPASPQANSGVYIRIADKPKDPWYAVHHGYEVQISDSDDEYHGTGVDLLALRRQRPGPSKPPASGTPWRSSCAARRSSSPSTADR